MTTGRGRRGRYEQLLAPTIHRLLVCCEPPSILSHTAPGTSPGQQQQQQQQQLDGAAQNQNGIQTSIYMNPTDPDGPHNDRWVISGPGEQSGNGLGSGLHYAGQRSNHEPQGQSCDFTVNRFNCRRNGKPGLLWQGHRRSRTHWHMVRKRWSRGDYNDSQRRGAHRRSDSEPEHCPRAHLTSQHHRKQEPDAGAHR